MYKLIACDLDETLLDENKEICQRNIDAIKKAEKDYGVKFVPATGRGYTCIDDVLKTLDMYEKENEYIISNNGGILCENKDFKHLSFHNLPFEDAEKLIEFGFEKGICIQVFTAKDVYAYNLNENEKEWLLMFKPDAIVCDHSDYAFLKDERIAKILFQKEDVPYLMELAKEMEPLTKGRVSVSFSSGRYLELNRIGVDKGLGLRELANHLGVDISETMAIGDNFNDLEMLKVAGLSVAMQNAAEEVKAICDFVTEADHIQGGVAEAIEKYIFC